MSLCIKRIYDKPSPEDGFRVLVDRLWPRGISKERAKLDLWPKEVAPSSQLRQWFNHDAQKFAEFDRRYRAELKSNPALKDLERSISKQKTVTLLYGAKDPAINQAAVLRDYLNKRLRP